MVVWFIVAFGIGQDILDGICSHDNYDDVDDCADNIEAQGLETGSSWWGAVVEILAVLNVLIGLVASAAGLKHMLNAEPTAGGQPGGQPPNVYAQKGPQATGSQATQAAQASAGPPKPAAAAIQPPVAVARAATPPRSNPQNGV